MFGHILTLNRLDHALSVSAADFLPYVRMRIREHAREVIRGKSGKGAQKPILFTLRRISLAWELHLAR